MNDDVNILFDGPKRISRKVDQLSKRVGTEYDKSRINELLKQKNELNKSNLLPIIQKTKQFYAYLYDYLANIQEDIQYNRDKSNIQIEKSMKEIDRQLDEINNQKLSDTLQTKIKSTTDKISQINQKIKKQETRISSLTTKIDNCIDDIGRVNNKSRNIQIKIKQKHNEINKYLKDVCEKVKSEKDTQKRYDKNRVNRKIQSMQENISDLQIKIQKCEKEIDSINSSRNLKHVSRKELTEAESRTKHYKMKTQIIQEKMKKFKPPTSQINKLRQVKQEIKAKLKSEKQKYKQLLDQYKDLLKEAVEIKKQIKTEETRYDNMVDEVFKLENSTKTKVIHESNENDVCPQQNYFDGVETLNKELENDIKALNKLISDTKFENSELRHKINQAEAHLMEFRLNNDYKQESASLNVIKLQLEEMQWKFDFQAKRVENKRNRVEEMKKQVQKYELSLMAHQFVPSSTKKLIDFTKEAENYIDKWNNPTCSASALLVDYNNYLFTQEINFV